MTREELQKALNAFPPDAVVQIVQPVADAVYDDQWERLDGEDIEAVVATGELCGGPWAASDPLGTADVVYLWPMLGPRQLEQLADQIPQDAVDTLREAAP